MKKKVLIGITIAVIAILSGVFVFQYIQNNKEKPETVFTQYMSYINDENYSEMYNLLTEESKKTISKEDFIKRNSNIYKGIEASNIKIELKEIKQLDNQNSNITYKTSMDTLAGKLEFDNSVELIKNDGKYYIDWSSNLIYPNLNNADKIKVNTQQAKRGNIYDRNDKVIASEGIVSSVGLVPGKINSNTKEADIKKIAELLEISEDSINKALNASYVKDDTFVALKNVAKDNSELKQKLLQIKGIKITDAKSRVYTYGEELAHLVGYIQNITAEELKQNAGKGYTSTSKIGKSGLEKIYEDRLKGTNGAEIYITDSSNNKKETIAQVSEKNGEDIKLTIDVDIQKQTYEQFKDDRSASVVMNPKTGEILALVSTPTYNANDFLLGMSTNKWNELSNDESKPLYNRYLATWVPGSSFKPVIGAIGVSTNKINSEEDFGTSGTSWQKDSSWGDHFVTTLATYSKTANLQNALIYSDNIYFAKAALKIGSETLKTELEKIGFNKSINFGQVTNSSQYANGSSFSSEGALADTGYGQAEVLVNPIHIASIYSAFVNEGNMIMPYIEYKENVSPEYYIENAFTKEAAETIKQDLVQVVEDANGTANSAKISGIKLAGKTGTAEIKKSKDDTEGTEIGWFNSFVADENSKKQLLVVSMVEDVKARGGSHYLLPKVKSIFEKFAK
ncbi:MAG: penicillin-binding transpeptidase domain-containing protein [Clostridia bacterium]|nr:penicillin-binding transpeptidase domain-containing protein [Clostridia bacterium]